jgi:1A family penicillin-binding protein
VIRIGRLRTGPGSADRIGLGGLLSRVIMIPVVVAVSALLVAIGLFPALGGAGAAVKRIDETLLANDDDLKIPEFPLRSTIYAADGSELATVAEYNRIYVKLDDVNEVTRDAVLAIEDSRFYEHGPVDAVAIIRAAFDNLVAGEVVSGASTISQQLVKNTVIGDEVTFERKFKEAQAAIQLERTYTKDQILELYLNQVYLGHGTYGVGAAAEFYFGKSPPKLKLHEAALLAAMIQRPAEYDPIRNRPAALARRNFVLSRMREVGWIGSDQYAEALAAPIKLSKKKRTVNKYGPQPYFVDYVRQQILHPLKDDPNYEAILKAFGKKFEDRERSLYQGGLKIYTTLRRDLQKLAERAVEAKFQHPGRQPPLDPQASVLTIVPQTGAIQTMYGGADFSKEQFNLATQARRGAGSAFKAFTLAAAFEQGMPVGKVYKSSSPAKIDPEKCPDPDGVWTPANAEGGGGGYVPLTTATALSINVVFAQLIGDIGPSNVARVAERMGVRSYARNAKVSVPPVCSITLGSVEVSPLAMASGFSTLANEGVHCWPFAMRKVVSAAGKTIFKSKPSCKRRLEASVAAQVTSLLRGVTEYGTATVANLPDRPEAGKTGTGQDYKDAWFMGYIPQLVTGVWVGYTEREYPMIGLNVLYGGRAYGGTIAAPIWAEYMREAVKGLPVKDFPIPPPQKGGTVPDVVGLMQEEAEKVLSEANFTPIPETVESHEPAGTVVAQSPAGGASATLGSGVTISISDGKGPPPVVKKTVPDVVDMLEDEAKAALKDAGFKVDVMEQCTDDPLQNGLVLSQDPEGGKKANEGSTVTIWVGKNPDPPDTCSPDG